VGPSDGRRPGLREIVPLTRCGRSESWLAPEGSGNRADWSLRQGTSGVTSPDSCSADNAGASCFWDTGSLLGDWKRGTWLQLVRAPSSARPPEVGDAGNGYSTSSWTISFRRSRSRVGEGMERVAAGGAAQAESSGVGDLADARDNWSVAEVGKRYLFQVDRKPRAEGKAGIAVRGEPISPDKAGFTTAAKRVLGMRAVRPNSRALVTYLVARRGRANGRHPGPKALQALTGR
jgi:hypothetical protein